MDPNFLLYKGNRIFFETAGSGNAVIFLHGYQADSRIWKQIASQLIDRCFIILPDLPGHGKTPLIKLVNSMEYLADIIHRIVLSRGLHSVTLVGHSMGGYVALAYAEKYYNYIEHLVLINAHPFADEMNKVMARNREADLIDQGKKRFLLRNFVKNNFYAANCEKNTDVINWATKLALDQPENGMTADLAGMMARPDRIHVLKKLRTPVKVLLSEADEKLPQYKFNRILSENIEVDVIPQAGHISLLDNPDYIVQKLIPLV